MAAIVRIKRSATSGNPTTLGAGELAYSGLTDNGSNGGDRLYVGFGTETAGNAANHFVIGGKYFTDIIDGATDANTANKLVKRDGSGNFSAGTITANLSGNASTASSAAAWTTGRTITIDGDVDGSASGVDGSGDVTITTALDATGVSAGSYGSTTAIPIITVDAKGRITAASTGSISTSFTLTDGSSSETISGGDTLTVTAGEGIDVSAASGAVTVSAEDATASNKGIASFNSTDFSVSSGAVSLAKDPTITLTGDVTGDLTGDVTGNVTGNLTGNVTGNITGDIVSGVTTASTAVNVGTGGTALAALNTGRVGIGSAIPKSDLTIRKTSDASLEIVGESGQTKVSLGKSDTDGNESALIRYGNPDGSLNFVNYNPGSVNTFIHAGTSTGIQTGRFSWIYGQSNAELLSLTHEGKVGVGKTNPDFNLEVVGTSTITSDLGVGGNLAVDGNVTLTGSITLPPVIETNLNAATGISTLNNVSIGGTVGIETSVFGQTSTALFNRIGIQTDTFEPLIGLRVNARSEFNFIGIGTTASPDHFFPLAGGSDGLHLFDKVVGFNSVTTYMQQTDIGSSTDVTVGIGTSVAAAAIDFRFAGNKVGAANTTGRFMIPPTVTTDEKVGLATQPGGIVYDLTLNKLQCFNGTTWNNLF